MWESQSSDPTGKSDCSASSERATISPGDLPSGWRGVGGMAGGCGSPEEGS